MEEIENNNMIIEELFTYFNFMVFKIISSSFYKKGLKAMYLYILNGMVI